MSKALVSTVGFKIGFKKLRWHYQPKEKVLHIFHYQPNLMHIMIGKKNILRKARLQKKKKKEKIASRMICTPFISSKLKLADVFTKGVPNPGFGLLACWECRVIWNQLLR